MALEDRTARLTILIDPRKKSVFERLCAEEDATPSQMVRRLIRRYVEERLGRPWTPAEHEMPKRDRRRNAPHGKVLKKAEAGDAGRGTQPITTGNRR